MTVQHCVNAAGFLQHYNMLASPDDEMKTDVKDVNIDLVMDTKTFHLDFLSMKW